jgi:cytochrome c553
LNSHCARLVAIAACLSLGAAASGADIAATVTPQWLYPLNPPSQAAAAFDQVAPLRVPGSALSHTAAELHDLFLAADWFPASHSQMPQIVSQGRKPEVYACGYCHTPGGQGRPENASLAGLPAAYIIAQVEDIASGVRRSAGPSVFVPSGLMTTVATHVKPEELADAAEYFSQQRQISRVRVIESNRVPKSHVVGWVYVADPGHREEPLGMRLLEFAPDAERHENRDDAMQYLAYAPVGSLKRGRIIALTGSGSSLACVSCHGENLQGVGLVPGIAGRSPSYLLRQLLAFQTGDRASARGQPMLPVVAALKLDQQIDVVAYAASLLTAAAADQSSPRR